MKVTEQTVWQLIGKLVTSITSFIAISLIARNYGLDGAGIYTLALTYLTMFFIINDLGLNAYVITKLETNLQEANKLFNIRFYWSLVLAILSIVLVYIFPLGNNAFQQSILLGVLMILGNGIINSTNLIFQYKLRFDRQIICNSLGGIAAIIITILLIYFKSPIQLLILGPALGWMITAMLALIFVKQFFTFKFSKVKIGDVIYDIKTIWPVSLTLILNVVYFRLDAFIISSFKGFADVGIYNVSYTLFQTALVIPTFIMNSYYPIILGELNNISKLMNQLKLAFFLMTVVALIGTVLTFILSPIFIHLWVGDSFLGSVTSINILSLSFPAFFGSSLLMWTLVSFKKYKTLMYIYLFGLVLNFGLNIILVPKYSYIGSSWVTVFSEYAILIFELMAVFSKVKVKLWN